MLQVIFKEKAIKKIEYFTQLAPGEISGLGKVEKQGDKFIIEDVYLLKQTNSAAYTELDSEAINDFLIDMMSKGEDLSKIKLWWHTHANFSVFWSGTDKDTIDKFANESYFISLVTNKAGDYKIRFDFHAPDRLTFDDIPHVVDFTDDNDLKRQCEEEFNQKVKTRLYWDEQPQYVENNEQEIVEHVV